MMKQAAIVGFLLLLVGVWGVGQSEPDNGQKVTPKVSSRMSRQTSPKVAQFLRTVMQAKTLAELGPALERAGFTQKEYQELQQAITDPVYSKRIEQLKRSARPSRPASAVRYPGKTAAQVVAAKKKALAQAHQNRIKQQSNLVMSARQRHHSSPGTFLAQPIRPPRQYTVPKQELQVAMRLPGGGTPARISEVEPREVVVGASVTIQGSRFGSQTGQVAFILDEELFYCDVSSWRDSRITAQIPAGLDLNEVEESDRRRSDRLPIVSERALLWAKLHGGETGPTTEIYLEPDLTRYQPEITAISPSTIEPGMQVLIEGSNFLAERSPERPFPARIEVLFDHDLLPVDILEWQDTFVRIRLDPSLTNRRKLTAGMVRIRNRLLQEAQKGGIVFEPIKEIVQLEGDTHGARCHPTAIPPLCLVGEKKQYTDFDLRLRNDWVVEDAWLETSSRGINGGAYYNRRPTIGSDDPTSTITVWADAYSMGYGTIHVTIKGPKGLPHY
jgi:hypothetical protein